MATTIKKKVLGEVNAAASVPGAAASKQNVEDIYVKKTQLEHILLRPDTYIGSVQPITQPMAVFEGDGFVTRDVTFVPGLFKIFDEIMVNAADNKQRDSTMDTLKVNIDREAGTISVYNTGRGIPVQMHKKEKMYVPELIFGNLLTSSNYDDGQKKVTGGRNGYGAKLCNIFSSEFVVETCDMETGLKYRQVFSDNMGTVGKPKIVQAKGRDKDFTRITFTPDLAKFGMEALDDDIVAILSRRVYDVAGTTRGVKVYLNDTRVPINSFKDYVSLALRDEKTALGEPLPVVYERVNDRWEVCMTTSESGFQQMSFVNSIATTKGGTHVGAVTDQLVKKLEPIIKRKNKSAPVKSHQIKAQLRIFVNCLIENPTFDSQTKENMTLRKSAFGSDCPLGDKFLKDCVSKTEIVDQILAWAKAKSASQLSRATRGGKKTRVTGVPKLDDANEAGGRNAHKCTLILTEGDSAKALAVSGLGVVGRDYYGVFPLRGKLLNAREATSKQIRDNAEIQAICTIMGLQFGKTYENVKQLRYGRLMIMTDQDQDGSHIKGLLINLIQYAWPSLLKMPGFLIEFVTPIVKVTKGKTEHSFFTLPEYEAWSEENGGGKGWRVKYYKGLGTSTPKEAKEYFSDMPSHEIPFRYDGPQDDTNIELAFSKKRVEDRKDWLRAFKPGTYLSHDRQDITYTEFINQELILFSMADNVRSIPSVIDGFKPGQRKVLFSCFKRNLKEEIKVAQLAGYVSEHSSYHHGEVSLAGTIVNMAQDFVGTNNIHVLEPVGQFGTRLQGGKDSASPRYIFTKMSPITRALFHKADDQLLNYLTDDGASIEPEYYVPVLPMVLINGSDGIGTGWSSFVPNYNPRDIVANLKAMIAGEECGPMHPWYRGFEGEIEEVKPGKYAVHGILQCDPERHMVRIIELPVRHWTQTYKEWLEKEWLNPTDKKGNKMPARIESFKEHHTDKTVAFEIQMSADQYAAAEAAGLEKVFKMESSLSTTNMTLFDGEGRIKKYDSVQSIMNDFFAVRKRLYQERKQVLADDLTHDYKKLNAKVRFITMVIQGELVISNRKRVDIFADLKAKKFPIFNNTNNKRAAAAGAGADGAGEEGETEAGSAKDFDYLLGMPMWSLTMEKVQKLQAEKAAVEMELDTLLGKTPEMLWLEDLDVVSASLDEMDAADAAQEEEAAEIARKVKKRGGATKSKKAAAKAADASWEPPAATKKKAAATKTLAAKPPRSNIVASVAEPRTALKRVTSPAVAPAAKVSKKVAVQRKTVVKKPAFEMNLSESESEDEEMGLLARLAAKNSSSSSSSVGGGVGGAASSARPARATAATRKTIAELLNSESESEEEEEAASTSAAARAMSEGEFVPSEDSSDEFLPEPAPKVKKAPVKAKAKAKKITKKAAAAAPADEFDFETEMNKENAATAKPAKKKTATKAKAKKAPVVKRAPAKKKVSNSATTTSIAKKAATATASKVMSDSEYSEGSETEMLDMPTPKPRTARGGRRAAAQKVRYTFSSEEEESEEEMSNGSDFEL